MYKSTLLICLWILAGSSYTRDTGGVIRPYIHVPKMGKASSDTTEQRADRPKDIVLAGVRGRLYDSVFLERLLRHSGRRTQNEKARKTLEHRKLDLALTSLNLFKTKLNILPPEFETFTKHPNKTLVGHTSRDWHGLYNDSLDVSYARFEYLEMNLTYQDVSKANVTVTLTIANVGDAQGDEVVECYVSWANKSLPVPREQLVYFDRIRLDALQTTQYAFTLTWLSWAYWSSGTWIVQTGNVTLCCGDQKPQRMTATNILCSQFPAHA